MVLGVLGVWGSGLAAQQGGATGDTVARRFGVERGWTRLVVAPSSFGSFLRGLPLRPGRGVVHLHDGRQKPNQEAHVAVVDLPIGRRDLEQCADAVMRLYADYVWGRGCADQLVFSLVNGDQMRYQRWRQGWRPRPVGQTLAWSQSAAPADDVATFRRYLDTVYTYASTLSLGRDLQPVAQPEKVEIGDVFLKPGSPGHAVLVVDVAVDERGARHFLLAQSYMPAQEIHVLRGPGPSQSPWYPAAASGELRTPEWRFEYRELHRFPTLVCP